MMAKSKPIDLDQAMNDSNWLTTMQEELWEIKKSKTCELVEKLIKRPIDVKRVYNLKLRPNGEVSKHKVRIVEIGFLQKPGVEFDKVYELVARMETIIIIVLTTTYKGWKIYQLDVKSLFLNAQLE